MKFERGLNLPGEEKQSNKKVQQGEGKRDQRKEKRGEVQKFSSKLFCCDERK